MIAPTTQQWLQLYMPKFPLASNDLKAGIYRTKTATALRRRYLEANPQALSNLLVVDIDHEDAVLRPLWGRSEWLPNAVVTNPANGHAHAIWALQAPFARTEYAHRKPIAYAAAVTEGLRRSVDGDQAYSGLMTKNPTHAHWEALWVTDKLYSLGELAGHLEEAGHLPAPAWSRTRRRRPAGLGRNCDIFESARTSAYRAVRKHFGNSEALLEAITADVHQLNAGYAEPLPHSEAGHIANSIHRWITTKSRIWQDGAAVYDATFTLIQHHRNAKSVEARKAWKDELREAQA